MRKGYSEGWSTNLRYPEMGMESRAAHADLRSFFAGLFFVLLFPFFFLYHYGLARGFYPSLLAGAFGPISLVAAPLMAAFIAQRLFRGLPRLSFGFTIAFLLFLVYTAVVAVAHYFWGDRAIVAEAQRQYIATAVGWVALFGIGFYLRSSRRLVLWNKVLLCVMAFIAWQHVDLSGMMFYARQIFERSDAVATYQGFARSFALSAMLVLAFERRVVKQTLVVLVSTPTLFILGARSEFAGFLLIVLVWFLLVWREHGARYGTVVLLMLIFLSLLSTQVVPEVRASRQLQLLDLSNSTSWQGRMELLEKGWSDILENPLFGNFGGHIRISGVGGYIHNALSAWHAFGLPGFVLYIGLSVFAFLVSTIAVVKRLGRYEVARLAFFVNMFSVLLIVVAKSVYWQVPALGWGLAAGLLRELNVSGRQTVGEF